MDLKQLGLDTNRGGGVMVVTGTVTKNERWAMIDSDTRQPISGHSFHLAFYGGVLKVKTQDDDPLRMVGVGEEIVLRMKISSPKGRPEQLGAALLLNAKTLIPVQEKTPSPS